MPGEPSAHVFSCSVRVVVCSGCGAPLEVDLASSAQVCGYCGASNLLVARDDTPLVQIQGPAATPIDEAERLSRLRRQVGRPLAPPAALQGVVPNGRLEPWKVQEVFAVWQSTREEARATGGFDAGERLLYLTMVLANSPPREQPRATGPAQDDRVRQRAMFESALVVTTLPRHRQVLRGYLSRAATRDGDLSDAEAWLAPCDASSDDLETDTAWRISRAYLDTARQQFSRVLEVLGTDAERVPIAEAAMPMSELLRANAAERTGDPRAAQSLLEAAMARGAPHRASLESIRELHRDWDLCPGSYPRAEAAYTARAAAAAGAGAGLFGSAFYWVGMAMNAASALALVGLIASGGLAVVVGLVPALLSLPVEVQVTLAGVASVSGVVAFTLLMVLPTTLPLGLVFWLVGRAFRNAGRKAERLRLHGRRGTAQVLKLAATGMSVNDVPQLRITLRVELPGTDPYEAATTMVLPPHESARLAGATVPIRVDPDDPSVVIIETD